MQSTTLTPRDAAAYLGMSKAFLAKSRIRGTDGPVYLRIGRAVRYRPADLDAWLEAKRIVPQHHRRGR